MEEVSKPEPSDGEALIKISKAGICNTDIEITNGYFQFEGTIGHEFVGVVEDAKESNWIGKRVVADINCACNNCSVCQKGDQHHCPNRTVLGILGRDGAMAEYLTVPVKNLVSVPKILSDNLAVFAEPVAAALEIQEQLELDKSEEICVIGDGKLGLLIALTLDTSGFNVHLLGRHPERVNRLDGFKGSYSKEAINKSYQTVVEATGNPAGFELAVNLTKPRGNLVLKSTYADGFKFNPAMVVVNELNIVGSRCGPIDKAIDMLSKAKLDPTKLIDEHFPLKDGEEAIKNASSKGTLKVILDVTP